MALNWFFSFAYTIVLGNSGDEEKTTAAAKENLCSSGKQEIVSQTGFQMPLHYPRYSKSEYEKMEEWKLDMLFREYGLCFEGSLDEKRTFAIGAFLWPDQI